MKILVTTHNNVTYEFHIINPTAVDIYAYNETDKWKSSWKFKSDDVLKCLERSLVGDKYHNMGVCYDMDGVNLKVTVETCTGNEYIYIFFLTQLPSYTYLSLFFSNFDNNGYNCNNHSK